MAETAKTSETPGGESVYVRQRLDSTGPVGAIVPHPAVFMPGLAGIAIDGAPGWALFAPIFV